MAIKTETELRSQAAVIRDETGNKANTAVRVGNMFLDLIDSTRNIPMPVVSIIDNGVKVYFQQTNFDFTQGNPSLFLLRWRNGRNKKVIVNGAPLQKKQSPGWVHPTDKDAAVNWEGWKYFNGVHHTAHLKDPLGQLISPAQIINERQTEFPIAPETTPYNKWDVDFNRFMFWNKAFINEPANIGDPYTGSIQSDQNFINGLTPEEFANDSARIGGARARLSKEKIQTFCFTVAVDNPNATKENNQCPKFFGPLSQPFNTYPVIEYGAFRHIGVTNNMISKFKNLVPVYKQAV